MVQVLFVAHMVLLLFLLPLLLNIPDILRVIHTKSASSMLAYGYDGPRFLLMVNAACYSPASMCSNMFDLNIFAK